MLAWLGSAAASAQPAEPEDPGRLAPGLSRWRIARALDFRLDTRHTPRADFGDGRAAVHWLSGRVRATLPVASRTALRLGLEGGPVLYDFGPGPRLFQTAAPPGGDPFSTLYQTELALQIGHRLAPSWRLLSPREQWSLLGEAIARARWERGAPFAESLTPGGTLAFGYALPRRFELLLGARVEERLTGGVRAVPVASLRWRVDGRWTLRSAGLGGRVEYQLSERLELFVSARLRSRRYRLADRALTAPSPAPSPLYLRDRQVPVVAGVDWAIAPHWRAELSVGATAHHELRVTGSRSDGGVSSREADPAPHVKLRVRWDL